MMNARHRRVAKRSRLMGRTLTALGCTAVVTSLLVIQPAASASAASSHSSTGRATSDETLTFGEYDDPTSLDPIHLSGAATSGGDEEGAIYGYLMRYDAKTNQYVPYLAKSMKSSDNFMTWTLTLRPGMTFSDGTPFNAQAVVENIQREMASQSVASSDLALVQSVTATNSTTVVFTLKQPWSTFPYVLSTVPGGIAAPSYLAKVNAGDAQATPIGAGPFEVENSQPGTSWTLKPNPTYALVKPKLSTLKFTYIPGGTATLQAFQAGQLNAAFFIDAQSVKQIEQEKLPVQTTNADMGTILLMNNRSGTPLANQKLREAVTLAFDPTVYNEQVNFGVPLASNLLFSAKSQWYTRDEQKIPYNPKKAAELVKQVKSATGWNGTLNLVCSSSSQQATVPIEAMLEPVGIKLNVIDNLTPTALSAQVLVNHNYDLACFGAASDDANPYAGLHNYLVGGVNYGGYNDPAMTTAMNELAAAGTLAGQKAAMKQVISAFLSSYPFVDTGDAIWATIHKPNVHGLYQTSQGITLFDKATVS